MLRYSSTREDLLWIPPACAALSLLLVAFKILREFLSTRKGYAKISLVAVNEEERTGPKSQRSLQQTIEKLDGFNILFFRVLRLLTVFVLLSLEVYEASIGHGPTARAFQIPFFIYMLGLAISSMIAPTRWRDAASLHQALLLFADFLVYFILDVWPYAMVYPIPFDPSMRSATWIRAGLLTFGGVIVPLVMPRPFRPSTPDEEPSLSETCSLLSRYTYSYLDAIVFHAYRVPDITIKDMPQMPGPGRIEALGKRALAALDPVQAGKRHIIWGILRVWGKEWVYMMIFIGLYCISEFADPYGTRNLLASLETGTPSHNLRPWVWILVLVLGPVVSGIFYTQFLYVSTRMIVENTSVLTYLVFHHSLRIRLKGEILDSDEEKKKGKNSSLSTDENSESTSTPATVDTDVTESDEGAETDASTTTSAATKTDQKEGKTEERTGHLIGKINNLITSDLTAVGNLHELVSLPGTVLQLIISIAFLYNLLGWSALVGLGVMIICLPVPVYLGNSMASTQRAKMQATDKRVQSVTEALGVLRMIKLFGWEPYMLNQLAQRRDEELVKLRRFRLLNTIMNTTNEMLPLFSKLTVISLYTLVSKGELLASRIFTALVMFGMMEQQLYTLMRVLPNLLQSKVSCDRYTHFLNKTELINDGNGQSNAASGNTSNVHSPGLVDEAIGFKRCSFSWDSLDKVETSTPVRHHTRKTFKLRFDDEVLFKHGKINLVVGPTASGKTSVLMALLGEMYFEPHGIGSWYNLSRTGGVAYAPQESWVLNETIRDNILFGEPYDEERYKKVLEQCALEKDLELWEAGDLTEVGEKGLTLSGGQKARVTLARALYSRASILLLDDILAALDVHTAKWIVEKALQGDLVQGRTILLVTHNIALAAPVADHVVVLGRHGTISAQGTVADVLKKDSRLRAQVEKEREEVEGDIETKLDESDLNKDKDPEAVKKATGKLVVAEEKAMGRVELAAILLYVASVGGPVVWIMILGTRLLAMVIQVSQTWFMGYWSSQYQTHPASDVPVLKYLLIFSLANGAQFATDFASSLIWLFKSLRASKIIYSRLLQSIFKATFRWLDVTPVGRIITRCTQDISTIDEQLVLFLNIFISLTLSMACLFISSVIMTGWYALISGLVILVLSTSLGQVYLKCQMSTRREMSNAKAPVMSQVGTALSGLPSIRAYGAQSMFYEELKKRIDILARTSYCFYDINRWISIRMDMLGAVFAGVVAGYLVYGSDVPAGIYNLLEIQANSLERMLEFMRIDHEPEPSKNGMPPAYWPSSGELQVQDLSARYSDDSPYVLHKILFSVKAGERVGIVGRTGAGKSSVALALLRAIKTEGKVYYDGIATDEINLDTLRSNITLIPQQPELLHGTLRENLDPFGQHDDATLNDALNAAGLFSIKDLATNQQSTPEGQNNGSSTTENVADVGQSTKIGLDTMVESGGTNFSVGQRQIIALARAIVRRSKLLILDEATAAIDYDTDAAIQRTLRTEFSKDTTLLTIAHRLQTIMDYDKIMVLEAGQLVEFDTPRNLLGKPGGYFRALVDESDDRDLLHRIAGER